MDGGRHGWFRWAGGPVPDGSNPTHSISIYDLMILRVQSIGAGTPDFDWREKAPCSDKVTRVLAVLMAEEKEEVLTKLVLYLQGKQNSLMDGFTVTFNQKEFTFLPKFIDRLLLSQEAKHF